VVQQRLVRCFETARVIGVESPAVPILIYCKSILVYKLFNSKHLMSPLCVHEPFLVLILPVDLVMASSICWHQKPSKETMSSIHIDDGWGPEQAGTSKGISLPLTHGKLGMADVERRVRNEGKPDRSSWGPKVYFWMLVDLNVDESENILKVTWNIARSGRGKLSYIIWFLCRQIAFKKKTCSSSCIALAGLCIWRF